MIFEDIYGHVWPNKRTQNRTHLKKTRPVRTERHTTLFFQRGRVLIDNHLIEIITAGPVESAVFLFSESDIFFVNTAKCIILAV